MNSNQHLLHTKHAPPSIVEWVDSQLEEHGSSLNPLRHHSTRRGKDSLTASLGGNAPHRMEECTGLLEVGESLTVRLVSFLENPYSCTSAEDSFCTSAAWQNVRSHISNLPVAIPYFGS